MTPPHAGSDPRMNAPRPESPNTPAALGFRMPAEWEPHSAVWLSWPHDTISFPHLEEAEGEFASFVAEIHTGEMVDLQVLDEAMRERATRRLLERKVALDRIRFHIRQYADVWFRDYGPIFVVRDGAGDVTRDKTPNQGRKLAMTKWIFNAWGNKYESFLGDSNIPYQINEDMRLDFFEAGMVLEGGSIEVNGAGTLLTTEQCLLHPNRNPAMSQRQVEQRLADFLGVRHFIWLGKGIEGDDTDGHIDDIARFANPATVLCALPQDSSDADYEPLRENYNRLLQATDQDGRKLNVVPLPTPGWIGDEEGRLPASYANFYIGNEKVLVPIFGATHDQQALEVIQSVFPRRKVVGLEAKRLVYGLGTFHCMSQQQPAV